MRRSGKFTAPDQREAQALARTAQILAGARDAILKSWMEVYSLVDVESVLSPEDFSAFCRQELDRLIERLSRHEFERYWDEVVQVANGLIAKGLSVSGLTEIIHYFEAGCNDFLLKPGEFMAGDTYILAGFMRNTLSLILTGVVEAKSSALSEQMTASRTVEAAFRPKPPSNIPGLDLGLLFSPAPGLYEVGGDFYDFFWLPDGRIAFTIGDASGRGVDALAAATMAKFMLRSFFAAEHATPAKALQQTNRALAYFSQSHEFVTAICGSYDPRSSRFIISVAGHPRPICFPAAGGPVVVEPAGPALGIIADASFPEWEAELKPDDLIFLYTDGLMEARLGSELFGEDRIVKTVNDHNKCKDAQHYVDVVNKACLEFCRGALLDDMTVVALRVITTD